jgi:type VI secretion system protein
MSAPRGLLSRIAGTPPAGEVEAVVAHLRALLGTWRGGSPSAPGFGLEAFVDLVHDLPEAADGMGDAIREVIEAYEPRLTNVAVRHIPEEGLVLRFEIEAELSSRRRAVRMSTAFRPGGRVEVRGR